MKFIIYNGSDVIHTVNTLNDAGYSLNNFSNY